MHADLRVLDPIWTTANITAYHGAMIYDTLFGLDANFNAAAADGRQMGRLGRQAHLHVRAARRAQVLRRRGGDGGGLRRLGAALGGPRRRRPAPSCRRVKDTPVVDDKTFSIVLSEPYGLVIEGLSTISTSLCYMMRKKDAETDPNQQIRETVGSGPFLYNRDETRPGNRHVYDSNPNYVPRAEPASAHGRRQGGQARPRHLREHRRRADRARALQAGEIDFYEVPPQDLVDELKKDTNLTVQVLNKTGHIGFMRLNHLHPPFNNVDARRGMLHLVKQDDVMRAIFGQSKSWQTCGSYFACGTPMTNDANTDWFKHGPDIAKAKELFKKAGYDGRPVVVLQATDHYLANPAGLFAAQWLRQAGINVDLAAMDWGALLTRRAVKKPPAEGGWNIFSTTVTGITFSDPDRVHRPGRERREGLVRLADQRPAGEAARQVGDRADARRRARRSPASCRRTAGTTSRTSSSASSSATPPGARTSPASSACPRWWPSGTWRRRA